MLLIQNKPILNVHFTICIKLRKLFLKGYSVMAHLPQNRVKTIMKTSENVDRISKEAVNLTTRAAELFIKNLTSESYKTAKKGKELNYDHIVNIVHNKPRYEFLEVMVPKKITVRRYKYLMAKKIGHVTGDSYNISDESDSNDDASSTNSSKPSLN